AVPGISGKGGRRLCPGPLRIPPRKGREPPCAWGWIVPSAPDCTLPLAGRDGEGGTLPLAGRDGEGGGPDSDSRSAIPRQEPPPAPPAPRRAVGARPPRRRPARPHPPLCRRRPRLGA